MKSFRKKIGKKICDENIRVIVLLSLCLQIVLIIFGKRRKYTARTWIRVVVWIAYLLADVVATLGIISRSQANSCDNSPKPSSAIQAFWTPFLLVHLGGPDTITAYSLEDNELWLRHLLNLLVQVGGAFYVFQRSWSTNNNNPLTFLIIPVYISGILKYGERTWVLWSASSKNFRESLIRAPVVAGSDDADPEHRCGAAPRLDTGHRCGAASGLDTSCDPEHRCGEAPWLDMGHRCGAAPWLDTSCDPEHRCGAAPWLDTGHRCGAAPGLDTSCDPEHCCGAARGLDTSCDPEHRCGAAQGLDTSYDPEHHCGAAQGLDTSYDRESEADVHHFTPEVILDEAYSLFDIFKRVYADLRLSLHELRDGMAALRNKKADDAFKIIEIELGIMYDVLYSKASIANSSTGMFLRSVSFLSNASALEAFWMSIDKHCFSAIDVTITYQLLIGAISTEIYAGVMLIFSERTLLRLSKHKNRMSKFIYRVISSIPSASINRKRWSRSIAQFNLLGFCVKDKPTKYARIQKLFRIFEMLEKFRYQTRKEVTIDLKKLIFQQLKQKTERCDRQKLCHKRGDYVLERKSCLDKFSWSVVDVEFDHSILLWHIATDLCYYSDLNGCYQNATPISKISKSLSDYMLYLLVMRPFMLPKGIGEIRYRDTCAEAMRFIEQSRNSVSRSRSEACRLLLKDIPPKRVKGGRSKSVLFDGCRLAKSLQALEAEDNWGNEEKWDMITQVWIEMLSYAAIQCKWNQHAQQLSQGGELLSHVCLLMTHLGLSDQFQISQGDTRMSCT